MTAARSENQPFLDSAAVALLLLVAAVVVSKDISLGGLRFSDASTHAMDGVLIHDWIAAGPLAWLQPIEFATRQYAHYPTLGIGRVYPPGFAVVEAAFFAIFGVSAAVARLCTLSFALLATAGCYRLARHVATPLAAFLATAFLITMPGVVHWTRQVMLEMPTLAILICATLATLRYLQKPNWSRLAVAVGLTLAAPFFKQTAVFIVPVLGAVVILRAIRKQVPVRHAVVAGVALVLPVAALFAGTLLAGGSATHMANVIGRDKSFGEWLSFDSLLYYPRTLSRQVGPVVLLLAGLGLLGSLRRLKSTWGILLLWLTVFYVQSSIIQSKETRYFFFAYLPIAIWAGFASARMIAAIPRFAWRAAVTTAVLVVAVVNGYRQQTPLERDYTPLIAAYEPWIRNKIILFEGHRDGDFIFAARRALGPRGCIVIRGSKVFYSCASDPRFQFASYVSSKTDVAQIIDMFGFETLFVEQRNALGLTEVDLLHDELRDPARYTLVEPYALADPLDRTNAKPQIVDVYRRNGSASRSIRFVDIPVPIAGSTIRIDLDQLETTKPGSRL